MDAYASNLETPRNRYDLIRVWIGQWPQQDRINDAENRRVCADAESQGDNDNGSKARPLEQSSNCETNVFGQYVHVTCRWSMYDRDLSQD